MITKEENKVSIRHYWRMRKWAKTQDQHLIIPNEPDMFIVIGESYCAEDCILCENNTTTQYVCGLCPLYQEGYGCNQVGSPWRKMSYSSNWGTWIINATIMAMIIKRLPEEKV